MSELDELWAQAIADAESRARAAGRRDIVDYLSLRSANDLARTTGIDWLFDSFAIYAGEFNRAGASIQIRREDPHRFRVENSTMVGRSLTLTLGVRSLTIEAGWPRVPRDGVIKGGGLARGRIRHFGNSRSNEDLVLVKIEDGTPQWLALTSAGQKPLHESRIRSHLKIFLGEH